MIERRGEIIDVGFGRLAEAATVPSPTLDDLLAHLVSDLVRQEATDDIAILAFRWTDGARAYVA